jgi:cell division initiation protein
MRSKRIVSEVLGDEHAITPSELSHPSLRGRLLGGYRKKAVHGLLERAADRLENLLEDLRAVAQENELLTKQMDDRRRMEETLRQALMSSQKFSEDILESARREADTLLAQARVRAEEARLEATRLPERLAAEISALSDQRDRLRREILASLDAQRRLVESLFTEKTGSASFFEVHSKDEELRGPRNGSGTFADIPPEGHESREENRASDRHDTQEGSD